MRTSTDRILTTHVGSLPRPSDAVDLLFARDKGDPVDEQAFDAVIASAIADTVQRQVEAGIDIVDDGEMSKISYGTYVRHRLSGFEVGDRVIVTPSGGAFAERCAVPEKLAMPIPDGLDFEQAAGFTITYSTSYHALCQHARLQEGETVLVLGAAGGVGITAVEIAKALDARVIAAASTSEKLDFAESAGADATINYSETSIKDAVREITDGKGADVIYDPVGGEIGEQALRSIARGGRYLVIGFASGAIPNFPANLLLLKEANAMGVWWGPWAMRNPERQARNLQAMGEMIGEGLLRPRVTGSYSLDEFSEAFRAITARRVRGKVVFHMD